METVECCAFITYAIDLRKSGVNGNPNLELEPPMSPAVIKFDRQDETDDHSQYQTWRIVIYGSFRILIDTHLCDYTNICQFV